MTAGAFDLAGGRLSAANRKTNPRLSNRVTKAACCFAMLRHSCGPRTHDPEIDQPAAVGLARPQVTSSTARTRTAAPKAVIDGDGPLF